MLLAAGRATRLGELSLTTPKCLHRVGNELLFDRLVRQLYEAGAEEFLVNTHHLADVVREHVRSRRDHRRFTIVHESELLGTLGTLRTNAEFFNGEAGWVLHSDNFIVGSLTGLREGFDSRPPQCVGAMLTFSTDSPRACGVVLTDERGIVTSFFEKVEIPPSNEASAATFIFDGQVISHLDDIPDHMTDLSRNLLPRLTNRIVAIPHQEGVIDIGTYEGLSRAQILAHPR